MKLYYVISVQRQDAKPYRVVRYWSRESGTEIRTIQAFETRSEAEKLLGNLPTYGVESQKEVAA